jgi:hypothetical protein
MDFTFEAIDRGFQINDGKSLFSSDSSMGHVVSSFVPKAKVSGVLVIDGQMFSANGHGLLVNALQHKPQSASRWNFVNFQSGNHSIMMYQVLYFLFFIIV